ncbi:hypothetical protein D3C80_1411210 [compost metagenome]
MHGVRYEKPALGKCTRINVLAAGCIQREHWQVMPFHPQHEVAFVQSLARDRQAIAQNPRLQEAGTGLQLQVLLRGNRPHFQGIEQ